MPDSATMRDTSTAQPQMIMSLLLDHHARYLRVAPYRPDDNIDARLKTFNRQADIYELDGFARCRYLGEYLTLQYF
jgi:hypothetical protein